MNTTFRYFFIISFCISLSGMGAGAWAQSSDTAGKKAATATKKSSDATPAAPAAEQAPSPKATESKEAVKTGDVVEAKATKQSTDAQPENQPPAAEDDASAGVVNPPAVSPAAAAAQTETNGEDGAVAAAPADTASEAVSATKVEKKKVQVVVEQPVNVKRNADMAAASEPTREQLEESKRHMFVVTYNMAQPRGKTADFIDDFSLEGFGFEYRFLFTKQISGGIAFNWSAFERKESDVFNVNARTTINGTRIKLNDMLQLTASAQYNLKKQSASVIPFAGLHAGAYYSSHVIDWGWWYDRDTAWQFGFTPELGIRITVLPIPIYLSGRYTYTFKTKSLDAQQTLGINLGIAFLK
jgi:hypothetical protein